MNRPVSAASFVILSAMVGFGLIDQHTPLAVISYPASYEMNPPLWADASVTFETSVVVSSGRSAGEMGFSHPCKHNTNSPIIATVHCLKFEIFDSVLEKPVKAVSKSFNTKISFLFKYFNLSFIVKCFYYLLLKLHFRQSIHESENVSKEST